MNENGECPICFARISTTGNDSATNLSLHMSTHSKEEVVAALLGRTRSSSAASSFSGLVSRINQPINLSTNAFVAGNVSQPATSATLSIRQPQPQQQKGIFSATGITLSSVQQGTVVQNQSRPNTSNPSEELSSSGIPLNSFNIINNLANINNGAVGNSPKIVPTIATGSAFPSSSRPTQLLINNENSSINNHASDNSMRRNNLVNVQLQQAPILLPPPNSNINPSLPQRPVVAAAVPAPSVSMSSNNSATIHNNPSSMGGLMQVMGSTPCLIPQPNGVPIIVNVPTANYVQVPNQSTSTNCNIPIAF
jgi:hypothetical protein